MPRIGLVTHPAYLRHMTGAGHPEAPARLVAIHTHLERSGLAQELTWLDPRPVGEHWLTAVHSQTYVEQVKASIPRVGMDHLDPDTVVSPASYQAALTAVGGVIAAVDAVMASEVAHAFCAVRPPGHHALAGRSMGFCLFNTVAIGARYIQVQYGLRRILIVDWDVHHGNGTQAIFYDDPSVFYCSVHQYPFYPGTGGEDERGVGAGEGFTLNCPLPPGQGDADYVRVFDSRFLRAAEAFRPEFILISAGFDAHRDDPLANMCVTEAGFRDLTVIVRDLARRTCAGRLVGVLEGGYNLTALARSVEAHLEALAEGPGQSA